MEIKVLGPGCMKCRMLEKNTHDALKELGISADVRHVTDFKEIMSYGAWMTPGLVVDGKLKLAGKVASKDEIKRLLNN